MNLCACSKFWVVVPRTSTKAHCYAIDAAPVAGTACTTQWPVQMSNSCQEELASCWKIGTAQFISVRLSSLPSSPCSSQGSSQFPDPEGPDPARPDAVEAVEGCSAFSWAWSFWGRRADLTVLKHTGARDLQGKGGDHTRAGSAWVAWFLKNMASSLKPSLEVALGVLCRCRAAHGQRLISMITMQATECRESPDTANCPNYFQVLEPQILHDMCWYIMIYCILLYAFVIYCDNLLLHNWQSCRVMPNNARDRDPTSSSETGRNMTWHAPYSRRSDPKACYLCMQSVLIFVSWPLG